ncbi:MAG TPA: sensor histidine kinase [Acidimicrobiales bacterium]|nr:sensor histidine kinase [Acidimicrobiales bacterium]
MHVWDRWLADLRRPEAPSPREDRTYYLVIPVVIVVLAQVTRPGSIGQVLLLLPAVAAFWLRAFDVRLPAELFAAIVLGSAALAVSREGNLEGAYFLIATMVLYTSWTLGSWTRAILIAGVATLVEWWVAAKVIPEHGITWQPWAMANIFTCVLGRTLRHQQGLIRQLEDTRRELAEHAVAEERRRIARDLHDLAGHTLAAVLLHVTGARHVLRRDVDEAERALRDAEAVGRSSLDQIRATVAALRADERGTDPALPDAADLGVLVDDYRRAGLDIRFDADGDLAGLDGPVGTALHRIAREALTNVARHAPGNRVEVSLVAEDGAVRLRVVDSGTAGPAEPPDGPHFGLVGMAERARAVGGELDAGPAPGGWRVEARLPLPRRPEAVRP